MTNYQQLKEQLAFKQAPLPESEEWLDSLDQGVPHIRAEKDSHEIAKVCQRGRDLLAKLDDAELSSSKLWEMVQELLTLDSTVTSWRDSPEWSYKTIGRDDLALDNEEIRSTLPKRIELHPDVWMAYEWNYHRTARIILHEHLIDCLDRLLSQLPPNANISAHKQASIRNIRDLGDQILSTVPLSLGDIDHRGGIIRSSDQNALKCRGIGGYFLLWPIKIVKSTKSATEEQRMDAQRVFERIREYTGMKEVLGERSNI